MQNLLDITPAPAYKSFHGWNAENIVSIPSGDYKIYTNKMSSGFISCKAYKGELKGDIFSHSLIGGVQIKLHTEKALSTEKNINRIHSLGIEEFKKQMEGAAAPFEIKVGQIFFTWNPGDSDARRAVYEVVGHGRYKTVLLDGTNTRYDDFVKPFSEKFGIGIYYNEDEQISEEVVNHLVIKATDTIQKRAEKQKQDSEIAAIDTAERIERGKKLVNIPAGAVAVLVAELQQNECDSMSDYYGSKTIRKVYLAYSTHTKNNFLEMRKACLNSDEQDILKYATPPVKPEGEAGEYWRAPDEHRENYSMGAGYYLGDHSYSGWQISKERLTGWKDSIVTEANKENLYLAAADGRYFCETNPAPVTEAYNIEKVEVPAGEIQVIEYSDKAIAVIGDTKSIKEKLASIGGKYNRYLKCGEGWIFSKKKLPELEALLSA